MKTIPFNKKLLKAFTRDVVSMFPKKAFGFFLSSVTDGLPSEYIFFKKNVRSEYNDLFLEYGKYFVNHHDAGFITTPEESYQVERYIQRKKLYKVGVFHSHQRHPALISDIDADLHPHKSLWHLIISLRNPAYPIIKVFSIENRFIEEVHLV